MTLSKQEEEQERIDTMRNDADVRRQQQQAQGGSTFLDQYHSDIGGRFSVTQHETVIGRVSPKPPPLPSTSPWSGAQPEPGIEPSLGFSVDQLTDPERVLSTPEPASSSSSVQDPGPAEAPSDPGLSEHTAGPSSPTKGSDNG
jgi:hypothetical protein